MYSANDAKISVAGAGAFGLATALRLVRAGLAVTLFDPAPPGDNASGVAAGMLAPISEALFDPISRDHLALMRRARDLWPDFAEALAIPLSRAGVRIEGSDSWRAEVAKRLEQLGVSPTDVIDEDWRLDARPALAALRAAAEEAGVVFETGAVAAFQPGALTLADGRVEAFDVLVLATGPGVRDGRIAPETAALSPIKGQLLRATLLDDEAVVVRGEGGYPAAGEALAGEAGTELDDHASVDVEAGADAAADADDADADGASTSASRSAEAAEEAEAAEAAARAALA